MSDLLTLTGTVRTEFGKGAARRARRAATVPAIIYEHGDTPIHVNLPAHATMMALKQSNALLTIVIDGKKHLAIAKDVQRHPVRRDIIHVDLLAVKKGERITVEVPITLVGESFSGTILVQDATSVQVTAEATNLPEVIEVSVEGAPDGTRIFASDLELPAGAELVSEPDTLIAAVDEPRGSDSATEGDEDDAAASPAAESAE